MRNKYYRGKFLIGVYAALSEGETLLNLCDNADEFAEFLRIRKKTATKILSNLFNGKSKYIKFDGKIRTVEFIDYETLD